MQQNYEILLKNPRWRLKRREILNRDGNKCRHCGSSESLQIHHKQYHSCIKTSKKILPWNYSNHLLITLCDRCHRVGHQLYTIPSFKI